MSKKKALDAIQKHGVLLVYPIKNQKEPASLWSSLYPRSEMVWEWDADADGRVSSLWILREELSRSGKVVYAKWYQNRATFFSPEFFVQMAAYLRSPSVLSADSGNILEALEMDSPLSTKQIKEQAELQGKFFEGAYNRAMKPLWQQLRIVGFGEVQDSSFPSLAVGASQNLFEELWNESLKVDAKSAEAWLKKKLGAENKFFKFAQKIKSQNRKLEGILIANAGLD